jgi:hypothetical protein
MISTRSAGLLIHTVVCLTLAKWETVSGRFGGYLTRSVGLITQVLPSKCHEDANHEADKHNQNSQMQKNSGEQLIRHPAASRVVLA